MRLLMNITIPHSEFNEHVRQGSAGQKIQQILQEIKPEAVYFTEQNGHRGGILIVNIDDPSQIPALAEPWFLIFNANVEFRIVMGQEDLQRAGLEELGKKWG
jgi:hypothetical protein